MSSYRVIASSGRAMIEVKRSRFLCRLERVQSEDAARAVVLEERREHWDARHHCSAFVLGPDGLTARSSDDGEPAGTAGAPMLEVLRGAEVSDVIAVVTRWFGGVLLGAGGLVRAYGDAVKAALDDAGTMPRRRLSVVAVSVPHAEVGRLEHDLRSRGVVIRDVSYAAAATLTLAVEPSTDIDQLVASLTAGQARPMGLGDDWVDVRP